MLSNRTSVIISIFLFFFFICISCTSAIRAVCNENYVMLDEYTGDLKTHYFGRESIMVLSLDLQAFILRARVLKVYRQALRVARRAPSHSRDELRQAIRQEMENNRHCDDKHRIRFLISESLERLKALDSMLDMQGHNQ